MKGKLSKSAWSTISLVLFVAAVYCALSPKSLTRLFLYKPLRVDSYSDIPETFMGAGGRAVTFVSADGKKLYGYFFKKPGAHFTYLLHHGQGGNLSTHFGLAKTAIMSGFSVLTYDYEGFGRSQGSPSNRAMLEDGDAAYEYLTQVEHVKPDELIHLGVSLGSGVASDIAMRKPCAAVALISPYTSLNKVAIEHFPWFGIYPPALFPQPDLGSLEFVKSNTRIPVMIIHGKSDPLIAARHAEKLYEVSRGPCFLAMEPKTHHGDFSTIFLATKLRNFARGVFANQKKGESDTIKENSPGEKSEPDSARK